MNEQKNLINETKKTKRCNKCGRELPIDSFSKNNKAKDGLYCWCKACHSKYRQTNKEHYNQTNNQFRNQFKGYYLYIILDKQDNVVYVGETVNYYNRLYRHLSGNVDSTQELFSSGDWSKIKYLDVSNLVENEVELRALENELIELYQPRLNTVKNIIRDIERGRLFSLIATLHSILNEWITFKTNTN